MAATQLGQELAAAATQERVEHVVAAALLAQEEVAAATQQLQTNLKAREHQKMAGLATQQSHVTLRERAVPVAVVALLVQEEHAAHQMQAGSPEWPLQEKAESLAAATLRAQAAPLARKQAELGAAATLHAPFAGPLRARAGLVMPQPDFLAVQIDSQG